MQALIDRCDEGKIAAKIAVVVANVTNAQGLKRAQTAGIPTTVIDHKKYPNRESFENEITDRLHAKKIEMVCLAGFMRLLTKNFVNQWYNRLINIHPSLLPKSRGPTPLTYIIDNPENAGVSIHKLTEKLDAGSILIQEKFEVENNETISSLMVKSQLLAETLLEELLNNFNELYNNATPQLEKLASFQSLPPVKRRFVNWDQNTAQFSHALRQYGHFGILISLDNALYIANDVEVTTFSHDFTCGSIIFEDALIKSIAINDGYVVLSKRSLRLYESRVLN